MVLLHVTSQPVFSEFHFFSVTTIRSLLSNVTLVSLSNIYLLQLWNKNLLLPQWGLNHQSGDRKAFWGVYHTLSLVWAAGCLSPRQTAALPKRSALGVQGCSRGNWHAMVDVNFDLSFPTSPPLLPTISKWRCLRNWYQIHVNLGIFSASSFRSKEA